MNTPELFVRMLLREKIPSSLLNDAMAIYSGEVKVVVYLCFKVACSLHF